MGMNELDMNGNLLTGLVFSYTNDDLSDVDLSNLGFETSVPQLPLDDLGLGGTPLFNPQVTLNGIMQPLQLDYDIPPGDTIQFLFPQTTDPFFIVQADISAESEPQFGFAYEEQVVPTPTPDRGSFLLLGSGLTLLYLVRCRASGSVKVSYNPSGKISARLVRWLCPKAGTKHVLSLGF